MNAEAQRRALSALWKAASSVFTDDGDDEESSNMIKAAPVQGDLRSVKYSAEMTLVFFLETEIKGTLPESNSINLTSLGLWGVSQTSGYLYQSAVKAYLYM